jgi:fibronectin-binding autotransporter adhesin
VGSLNSARESTVAVPLPNGLTLIVGGQTCAAKTVGGQNGFQCDALQTSELYNESTKAFTLAGSGSGGLMTIARSGPSATLIQGSGTALDGQVLIVGGSTGSSFLSITAPAPGPGVPPLNQTALFSAELYNPATDTFTAVGAIPGCPTGTSCATGLPAICAGPTSAISSASESGTTVTITMSSANPTNLIIGDKVTIANVSVAGYNGNFTVTAIPTGTTFQYTAATGLTPGSGGTAAADTSECGMVDQAAALIPNDGGKVLLAGGDLVAFLGQASNLSFIFDPTTETFSRTGSLATQRELFQMIPLDPSVVTGPLSGDVVAFGGIDANSNVCTASSTPVVATTLNTAEVFNPSTQTWSAASNTMGVKRAGLGTLFGAGSLAGEVILPGGVDVEAGTFPSTCTGVTGIKQGATAETDLYDPATGAGGTFTATGSLNQAREGQGEGQIGAGTDVTELLVVGGACTTASPSLQSVTIGTSQAATTCGSPNAQNDYSEIYSQGSHAWVVGPTFASGFTPTNAPASAVLP